jgi:hypothetical protein
MNGTARLNEAWIASMDSKQGGKFLHCHKLSSEVIRLQSLHQLLVMCNDCFRCRTTFWETILSTQQRPYLQVTSKFIRLTQVCMEI